MMAGLRSRLITINNLSSQSIAVLKTYTLPVPGLRLAFSPDCRTLAVVHSFYITIIDMVTLGTETMIPVPEVRSATSFTLKNDGVIYIFNEGHQKVRAHEVSLFSTYLSHKNNQRLSANLVH